MGHTIVLAPNPEWLKTLPNGKLPDRNDFTRYATDWPGRVWVWTAAASHQLAQKFGASLNDPNPSVVQAL